jgi:glycosyltransferase 2 family protein
MMLKGWRLWLGLVISLGFLYLALRGQDLHQVRRALAAADYRYLLPAIIIYFAGVWVRALRWRHLLAPVRPLTARTLFPVVVIGYMANDILPWRLGEFVRAYALRERERVPASASLATIAVERIFDGLAMLCFLLVASLFIPLDARLRQIALVAALIFGAALGVLALIVISGRWRARLLALVARLLPAPLAERLTALVEDFLGGLSILRSGRNLAAVAGFSLLAWGLESAMYLMIAPAFGLPLGPAGVMLTMAVANLATLVPSTPGYIGVFETGVVLVVNGVMGFDREVALSYAVVLHAALYFPVTLWGLYYWTRDRFSLGAVRSLQEESA